MPPNEYAVVVRGERFILSDEQLNFDAPNYFTELFGKEGGTRETFLYRDPKLFQLIEGYLSGYDVFPLSDTAIPPYMSRENISKNLLADARFYGLNRLVDKLNPLQSLSPPLVSTPIDSVHALWFSDPDPNARWKIKMRLTFSTGKTGNQTWFPGTADEWHETEEVDLARVKYWVNAVMDTPTRHFYPAPDYWPELENKVAWVELIGQNERFCFVVGKVRPDLKSSVVRPSTLPDMYESWFAGSDPRTKWKMKAREPTFQQNTHGEIYPANKWHDSGEFSTDIAKSWIEKVRGSSRYNLVPVPNHWPKEMEHVIGWIDNFTETQCIYVAMGKVRS